MKRILQAIRWGFDAFWRLLWYPGQLPACCRDSLGDHPDIESALRTGYPESCSDVHVLCPGCSLETSNLDLVQTDCGLYVCRDCIKLCEGCEAKVGCDVLQ